MNETDTTPPPLVSPPSLPNLPPKLPTAPRTSGLAIGSLICGLLPIPLIGSLAAIILSIKAKRQIERSQGSITGSGLATAGLICGIGFGLIGLVAMLAGIMVPLIISTEKTDRRSEAMANAKSIGLALHNFEQDYGSYPSAATAKQVQSSNPDSGYIFGSEYSNDYFRQLISAGYADSEKTFYAKSAYTKKPDNAMKDGKCLEAGEVGFGYIMASASEALSSKNREFPVIVWPLFNASSDGTFDPLTYNRKAVVLRIDNSASTAPIRPSDKKVLIGGGKTLFQSGEGTVWGDVKPVIRPPLKSEKATR